MPLSRFALLLVLVVLFPDRELASGTQVRVDGGRVIVQATGTPLTEVLSRFSEATGTKIVYDNGGKPRQLVTVEIDAASAAEALSQLLEGQGLGYALRLDPSGRGVEMLFLMGRGRGPAKASPPPTNAAAADRGLAMDPPEMEPNRDIEPSVAEPQEVEEPRELLVDPTPGAAPPVTVGPPGGIPPAFPSSWQPPQPFFPGAASYPAWR